MNNTSTYSISQKVLTLLKISTLSLRFFWILSIILAISLLAFYIFQISTFVLESYQAQNHQKKMNELLQENKVLEINSVKINSLENIETKIQELGLEKIDKIHYIQVLENPVVTKK